MQLSRKADYALRAVRYLSSLPKGKLGSINTIAQAEAIPREFLAKILKDLTRNGVLVSYQGVTGGYRLSKNPRDISFLNVIEAIEGPLHINLCTEGPNCGCESYETCQFREFWLGQEKKIKQALAKHSFNKYKAGKK